MIFVIESPMPARILFMSMEPSVGCAHILVAMTHERVLVPQGELQMIRLADVTSTTSGALIDTLDGL
jgi:hypothetical protein